MTKQTAFDRAVEAIEGLSRADLERLQGVISTLLSEGYLDTDKGYIEYKFIERGGKQYGPYKYRRAWVNGKLTSVYEGKASSAEYEAWRARRQDDTGPK